MTIDELRNLIAVAKKHEWAFVKLTVTRGRPPRTNEGRAWRGGPKCRYVFEIDRGRWLIEVAVDALERAIQ